MAKASLVLEGSPQPAQIPFFEASAPHIGYGGARGGGKAQPLDEPVLTPFGFRPMGSLKVGSMVMGVSGVAKVIQVHPQGVKPIYRVTFIDGASTRCTGDHLWLASKTCCDTGEKIYTTEELKELVKASSFNLLVPLCDPVAFTRPTRSTMPVAPYTMGVLLGDGCLVGATASFTTADPEIVRGVHEDGYITSEWYGEGNARAYGLIGFMDIKRKLDQIELCVKSKYKFIPDVYKFAPIADRYSIIQGLMDTDGYVDSRGHISFTSVSRQLADDVAWIIRSLGGKATITEGSGRYKKNGVIVECSTVYDVYIQTKDNARLFRLPRKVERCREDFNGGVSIPKRRIISIEPCGEAECQCITIDEPDGLYVTKDFIVTHNSWAMRRKFVLLALNYPKLKLLLLRRTLGELDGNHIQPLMSELYGYAKYNTTKHVFSFPNGSFIKLGYCDNESDVYQYQGQEYDVIGMEEATHFTEPQMQFLTTCNRSTRTDFSPRMYYTFNPGGVGHKWVKRLFVDRDYQGREEPSDYVFFQARVYDNLILMKNNPQYIRSLENLPESRRRAYLDGDWDVIEGQYFEEFRRDKHVCEPFDIPVEWKRFRSMDWGFNDPTAVYWYALAPDGHIYAYDEIYQNKTLVQDMAALIREKTGATPISYTIGSPDMWQKRGLRTSIQGESVGEEFAKRGVPIMQADNSRIVGWQRVRAFLSDAPDGIPWLQIFPNCKELIRTFPVVDTDEHNPEDVSSKCEDHACESLRYALMSRPAPNKINYTPKRNVLPFDPFSQNKRESSGFLAI